MLRTLGPAGLLRLATAIALGLSLLTGCAVAIPERSLAAATETDGTRCYRDHSAALTVVWLQP